MAFQIRRARRFLPPLQDQITLTISTGTKNGKIPATWTESSSVDTIGAYLLPLVTLTLTPCVNGRGSCFYLRVWPLGLAAN